MASIFKRLFAIFIFSVPTLVMLVLSALVYGYNYESWVKYLLKIAGKEDWEIYFREQILNLPRFYLLRLITAFFACVSTFFSFYLYKKRYQIAYVIKSDFNLVKNALKSCYQKLDILEKYILVLVFFFFFFRALYTINNTELQYDEAWTFVHFSSKGFLVSALSPNNNHQLYSLLSAAFWKLNFNSKFAIRLPPLIFSLTALFALFIFLNKIFSKRISIISVTILSVSIPFYFFSVLGRGYAPILFFAILSSLSILNIEKDNDKNAFFFRIYIVASILGFYSNPSFLYFWLANVFAFSLLYSNVKILFYNFLRANFIVILFTFLIFLPMILTGGLGILGAASENNIETGDFVLYLHRLTDWLFLGFKWSLFYFLGAVTLFFIIVNKNLFDYTENKKLNVLLLYWIWPFLIFVISGIETPYRIWFWMPIFFWLNFILVIDRLKLSNYLKISIYTVVFALNLYASQTHYFMNWSLSLDKESKKIAQLIINEKIGSIECYTFSRYDKPLLDYYFLINNISYRTYMPFQESKNYKSFNSKIYDAVLLDVEDYKASKSDLEILRSQYKVFYQNSRIKLYLSKIY